MFVLFVPFIPALATILKVVLLSGVAVGSGIIVVKGVVKLTDDK